MIKKKTTTWNIKERLIKYIFYIKHTAYIKLGESMHLHFVYQESHNTEMKPLGWSIKKYMRTFVLGSWAQTVGQSAIALIIHFYGHRVTLLEYVWESEVLFQGWYSEIVRFQSTTDTLTSIHRVEEVWCCFEYKIVCES